MDIKIDSSVTGGGVYIFLYPQESLVYEGKTYLHTRKVGKANNISRRLKQLSTSYICDIKSSFVIYPTDENYYTGGYLLFIEKQIHKLIADKRINPNREFFTIEHIEDTIELILNYFKDTVKIPIAVASSSDDLKDVFERRKDIAEDYYNPPKELDIYKPKDDQKSILDKMWDHYEDKERGKLILPPGYGKSYIASFHIRESNYEKVLVLTPQKSICEDFKTALDKCGIIGAVIVNSTTDHTYDNPFVVTTYASYLLNSEYINKIDYDLIIYDEAHHLCVLDTDTKNFRSSLDACGRKLFLTATEKIFDDDESFDMSDEKSFGETIHKVDLESAILSGMLCDYKLYTGNWNDNNICETMTKLRDVYDRKKVILFFNTLACSEAHVQVLKDGGFNVSHIDGKTTMKDRRMIINEFEDNSNTMQIICNVNIIAEGVNIPCIDTIMFMETRNSSIGVIQNIGRGLRLHPSKDFCMVLMSPSMFKSRKVLNAIRSHDSRITKPSMTIVTDEKDRQTLNHSCELVEMFYKTMGDPWLYKLNLAMSYNEKVIGSTIIDNIRIGNWYNCVKMSYKKGTLKHLNKLNTWSQFVTWRTNYEATKNDVKITMPYDDKIDLLITQTDKISHSTIINNIKIGQFYNDIKRNYKSNKLKQLKKLNTWPQFIKWRDNYENTKDKKLSYDDKIDLLIAQNKKVTHSTIIDDIKIGQFYDDIKMKYKSNKLKQSKLEKINTWPQFVEWRINYENTKDIKLSYDDKLDLLITQNEKITKRTIINNINIGTFYSSIKFSYKSGKLKQSRLNKLNTWSQFVEWCNDYDNK